MLQAWTVPSMRSWPDYTECTLDINGRTLEPDEEPRSAPDGQTQLCRLAVQRCLAEERDHVQANSPGDETEFSWPVSTHASGPRRFMEVQRSVELCCLG